MPTYFDIRTFPETNKVFSDFINPALTVIWAGSGAVAIEVDLGNSTFIPILGDGQGISVAFDQPVSYPVVTLVEMTGVDQLAPPQWVQRWAMKPPPASL